MLKKYWQTWWTVMARPIYFYVKLEEQDWRKNSLSFLLMTSYLTAAIVALAVFIIQYIPMGRTLIEGVTGFKLIIVLPVVLTLAAVFFMITYLILIGVTVLALGSAFYVTGALLFYVYKICGGQGDLNRMVQNMFYSSAVVLAVVFPALLAVLTRYNWLDLSLFRVGFDFSYFLIGIYVYGLWAVIGRRTCGVSKWVAFAGALVPLFIFLIFGLAFDKMAIAKVETWIAPLK